MEPRRVRPLLPLVVLCLAAGSILFAQSTSPTAPSSTPVALAEPAPAHRPSQLSTRDAIILGLVEGVTEFLPVSSTGHLVIANHLLGLEAETPVLNADGNPVWLHEPTADSPGVPFTLKNAADAYIVVIQIGAIMAVVFLYWSRLMGILRGLAGHDTAGLRLLRNLIAGCIPAGLLGLLAGGWIKENLFYVSTVIASLISGAVLMLFVERWRKNSATLVESRKDPADLTVGEALGVGLMQCLALWPGMSRSMVTIVGGYLVKLAPAKAAEFSFLLGLPLLGAAAAKDALQTGPAMVAAFGWSQMIVGTVVAAISATIAVKFFVAYLARHGLAPFAFYRIALAVALWFVVAG